MINTIYLPFESAQIAQIPLSYQTQMDQFIWGASKDGEYSVKSSYHQIKHRENSAEPNNSNFSGNSDVWKKVWELRIAPKQAHLLWRTLNNFSQFETSSTQKVFLALSSTPHVLM